MSEVTRQHATRRQTGVMFMTCTNGSRHYGWVENGKKHGVWMSVHTDGTTTETLYTHDQAVGNTTQRFASGEVLVGTCVGGRIQGPAMLQTKSGVVISGHYENGNFRRIICNLVYVLKTGMSLSKAHVCQVGNSSYGTIAGSLIRKSKSYLSFSLI